jgi:undecaprenyl-diphosphatase
MFTALHAAILGIIEGVTEFLPVSSTGHMILAASALRIPDTEFLKSFEIIVQLGAILAVVFLYWKKLLLNKKIFNRVAVAFIPTAVIGLVMYKFVKAHLLGNTKVVIWALLIGGALLIVFELLRKKHVERTDVTKEIEEITYKQALAIGVFQSVAIIPGVSRSAAFMLAVPTMAAATGLDILKSGHSFSGHESILLFVGLVVSFISALFAIKFLLRFVKGHTFIPFGIYRIVIAVAFLLYLV